ncbi:MAG: hypothetical protein AAB784_03490 [Patescibacteria group bacterium]
MAGNENKKDEARAPRMPASSGVVIDVSEILKVQDSVRAINNYAAGLSFAIPSENILGSYSNIIESQRSALSSALLIGERFQLGNERVLSFVDDAILPITSVMADIGLASANATKLYGIGSINIDQLNVTQNFSALALETIQTQQSIIHTSLASIENSGALRVASEIAPALQVVSSGVSQMLRSLPTFPIDTEIRLPDLETAREATDITEEDISEHQTKLDDLLNEIDPNLVEFRRGVWQAFNTKGRDYIGHASSSMRRLVDSLLRELAPQEKVEETEFFKTSPKAKDEKGRPTRRARILYAINWDQNKAEHLNRLTNGFLEAYDNLSAWDHHPLNKDGFVHGALIAIEGHLISILTVNEE